MKIIGRVLDKLFRVVDVVTVYAGALAALFMFAMTVIVAVATLSRYLLNRPFEFTEEVSGWLFLGIVFLGLAYTKRQGQHIRVDLIWSRLSEKTRKLLLFVYLPIAIGCTVLLLIGAMGLASNYAQRATTSYALRFPLLIPGLLMPIGYVLLILVLLGELWQLAKRKGKV